MTNVNDIITRLPENRRRNILARAEKLVAEEMTLRQLRRARKLTQAHVAKTLGINQDSVSRLESRSDLMLSTLHKHLKALGGEMSITVHFSDRDPVEITGFFKRAAPKRTATRKSVRTAPVKARRKAIARK